MRRRCRATANTISARERRRAETVAAAWREGRADPRVAGELDRFMVAAERRLGEEGMREAFRAVAHEGRMTVPGAGREQQDALTNWHGASCLAAMPRRAQRGVGKAARP